MDEVDDGYGWSVNSEATKKLRAEMSWLDINHLVTLSPTVLLNTHTIPIYVIGISFRSRLIDLGAVNSFHVDNAVFAAGKTAVQYAYPDQVEQQY